MLKEVNRNSISNTWKAEAVLQIKSIVTGERPPTENLYINSPSEIIDLIKSCWSHDDNMRPTMAKIIEVLNLINSSKGPFDYDKLSL